MKGRRTKLTKEAATAVCDGVRQGQTHRVACTLAGVDPSTMYKWLVKGRKAKRGLHANFHRALSEAEAQFEAAATRVVVKGILGGYFTVPVYDADGKLIPRIDPQTGERLRDSQGRLVFQTEEAYQKPDHAYAAKILAQRYPKDWANASRPSLDEQLDNVEAQQKASENFIDHHKIGIPLIHQATRILIAGGAWNIIPDDVQDHVISRYLAKRGLKTIPASSQAAPLDQADGSGTLALPAPRTDSGKADN
jgi:hypothetical protein